MGEFIKRAAARAYVLTVRWGVIAPIVGLVIVAVLPIGFIGALMVMFSESVQAWLVGGRRLDDLPGGVLTDLRDHINRVERRTSQVSSGGLALADHARGSLSEVSDE